MSATPSTIVSCNRHYQRYNPVNALRLVVIQVYKFHK